MKHQTLLKSVLIFLVFIMCSVLSVKLVNAQQISLSLSPTLTELAIKPAQSVVQKYKLINNGDPAIVKFQILPFEAKDTSSNVALKNRLESPIRFELENSSIKLDEPFFLKNNDSVEISLSILVPEGSPVKDYYFSLLAESQPPPTQEGVSNVRAKMSVGSNLLITVTKAGEVNIEPKISLFEVLSNKKFNLLGLKLNLFNSFEKIPIVLIVDNKGKNLIKPQGEIVLRGPFWQSKTFEIKSQNVLAESQRMLYGQSNGLSLQSIILQGFLLGNYKLSTTLSFGEGTPNIYATTSFFVLPIKPAILLVTTVLLLLYLVKKLKK